MIRSTHMPRRGFGLRSLVAAVAVVCSMSAGQSAQAVDITFDLQSLSWGQSTSSLTSGGYTLLFTAVGSPLNGSGGANGGTKISTGQTFSISKTAGATDLIFKSYKVGAVTSNSGNTFSFNLTGGTGTSNGNTFTQGATSNYNGSYSLVGSQTVTYTQVNFGNAFDSVLVSSLTFSTVPEPSTYALGAIATGVMAAIARRRKARKA